MMNEMKKLLFMLPIFLLVGCGNAQATNNADVVAETKKVVESTTKAPETTKVVETTKEEIKKSKRDELYEKYNGKTYKELYAIGGDEAITELAKEDLYCLYDYDSSVISLISKDEMTKIIQEMVDKNDINGFSFDDESQKIYDELKSKKQAVAAKEADEKIKSMIVYLPQPISVEQLGGNKVGENDGSYKGQYRETRLYGNTAFNGSRLVACNSLLGANPENYYECRNGFIVLKKEGNAIYSPLKGKERATFDNVEAACFKLNNPNIKITNDYSLTHEFGTFVQGTVAAWKDGFNVCYTNYLGQNYYMSGDIVAGKIVTGGWSGSYNYPGSCYNTNEDYVAKTNYSVEYSEEMVRTSGIEGKNAVLQKYLH